MAGLVNACVVAQIKTVGLACFWLFSLLFSESHDWHFLGDQHWKNCKCEHIKWVKYNSNNTCSSYIAYIPRTV